MKAVVIAVTAAVALVTPAVGAESKGAPGVAADQGNALEAAANAYRKVYPQLSPAQARTAASQQGARKSVSEALLRDGGKSFGGAWFDAPSGILHVATTTTEAAASTTKLGKTLGLKVQTHQVSRTFAELEKQADTLRRGEGALGKAARGQVGIDVQTNTVTVAVPAPQREALTRNATAGVTVVADPGVKAQPDAGCTARNTCDYTVRAGATLWTGSAGNNVCSVGFTARDANNQRYTLTAGHCSGGNGIAWGTGELPIGHMESSAFYGDVDAGAIRVTNSWFTGDAGGEIYHQATLPGSLPLNGVAPTLGYIQTGETVCLAANYTDPTGPNYCGVIGTNSDAGVYGLVRVDGMDACGGDSGGGWYWLTSENRRIGYGIHSRSLSSCHAADSSSWFSALPTVKNVYSNLNVEIRP